VNRSRELQRMGELAALDRYDIDRALELAGSGFEEDKAYGYARYPDAGENQRPPPMPPTLQEQPAWTREPVDPDEVRAWTNPYVPDEDWA
jgi:hypothetical protein